MQTNNDLGYALMTLTKNALITMAANHNLQPDFAAIEKKFQATYKERFSAILSEVSKDSKDADFFGQLDRGKISPMVNQVAKVTLQHGCVMYAKELLNIAD